MHRTPSPNSKFEHRPGTGCSCCRERCSGQRERRHYGPSLCCFFLAGNFLQRLLSLHLVPSQTLSLPTNPPITNTTHGITTLNRGPAGELPTAGLPVSMVDLFGDVKGALWAHQSQSEHYHFKNVSFILTSTVYWNSFSCYMQYT